MKNIAPIIKTVKIDQVSLMDLLFFLLCLLG